MATFVNDTFTDTNGTLLQSHTGETGATWTRHASRATGSLDIDTNRVSPAAAAVALYYASGTPANANYDVTGPFNVVTASDSGMGLAGRINTSAVTFYNLWYDVASARWELRRCVAGTYASLGTWSEALGAGATRTAKLEMVGTAIKAYVAGTERISAVDSNIAAAGLAGLDCSIGASTNSRVVIESITAADVGGGTNTTVTPGVGALAFAGLTPAVSLSANVRVTPGLGTLAFTGRTPSLTASDPKTASPGAGTLTLTGFAPTATRTANVWARPGTAVLYLTGQSVQIAELVGSYFFSHIRRLRRRYFR